MASEHRTPPRSRALAHFLGKALAAESGIDFRIASMALDAYQEITDMADVAMREIDAKLNIPEPF